MAVLSLTLTHACAGGSHFRFSLSVDGGKPTFVDLEKSDLVDPVTEADTVRLVALLARCYAKGRTLARTKTDLQAGVTVTV